jgi:hypothetical protein
MAIRDIIQNGNPVVIPSNSRLFASRPQCFDFDARVGGLSASHEPRSRRTQFYQKSTLAPFCQVGIPTPCVPQSCPDGTRCYFTANTQTAPPSGTSGYSPGESRFSRVCMPRESTPQPDCTAMYCVPSTMKEVA